MYFKARYYDPAVGRFITADPTIPNPGKSQLFNRYMFVAGSPIQLMDTSGFEPENGGGGETGGGGGYGGGVSDSSSSGGKSGGSVISSGCAAIAGAMSSTGRAIGGAVSSAVGAIGKGMRYASSSISRAVGSVVSGDVIRGTVGAATRRFAETDATPTTTPVRYEPIPTEDPETKKSNDEATNSANDQILKNSKVEAEKKGELVENAIIDAQSSVRDYQNKIEGLLNKTNITPEEAKPLSNKLEAAEKAQNTLNELQTNVTKGKTKPADAITKANAIKEDYDNLINGL